MRLKSKRGLNATPSSDMFWILGGWEHGNSELPRLFLEVASGACELGLGRLWQVSQSERASGTSYSIPRSPHFKGFRM